MECPEEGIVTLADRRDKPNVTMPSSMVRCRWSGNAPSPASDRPTIRLSDFIVSCPSLRSAANLAYPSGSGPPRLPWSFPFSVSSTLDCFWPYSLSLGLVAPHYCVASFTLSGIASHS